MSELVSCPSGCGNQVHRRAVACPRCGFRAEVTTYQEQMGSLSTVCSILTGFGLASLVTLAAVDFQARSSPILQAAVALWTISSLVLLAVLVMAELLRRQEVSDTLIDLPHQDQERFVRRCGRLLTLFAAALLGTAAGVVLLAFHFSMVLGLAGLCGSLAAAGVIWWTHR